MLSPNEFSRRSGLSPKALRIYADAKLLIPSKVGPNGYRFYVPEQLEDARTILLLRSAGVSIADIGRFLADPTPERLDEWERQAEADMQRRRECFGALRRPSSPSQVEVRTIADVDELTAVFDRVGALLDSPIDHTDEGRFAELRDNFDRDRDLMLSSDHGAALAFRTGSGATLRIIAVDHDQRRRGIGRALIAELERRARSAGVDRITLGTDEAAGFYFRLGYVPMLLLQWVFDPSLYEVEMKSLLDGPLVGMEYTVAEFRGVPQLFVVLDEPSFDLRDAVRGMVAGAHVGFCMTKPLPPQG